MFEVSDRNQFEDVAIEMPAEPVLAKLSEQAKARRGHVDEPKLKSADPLAEYVARGYLPG